MLHRREKIFITVFADTLFPKGGDIPLSGSQAELVRYTSLYLDALPTTQRILCRLLFLFIQLSPLLFGPKRVRFTHLDSKERHQCLKEMSKSSLYFRRIGFLSMRTILTLGYFAHPKVQHCLEYNKQSERPT